MRLILGKFIPGNNPDFLIVGAQKAGTTSLHHYLKQHPQLIGSRPKEVRYFDRDDHYSRGRKWYKTAFRDFRKPFQRGLYFEATPDYLYRGNVAERIHKFDPQLKIVIILRDPVTRAYSAWNMFREFPIKLGRPLNSLDGDYPYGLESNIVKELYGRNNFPTFEESFSSEMEKINSGSEVEEPSFIRRGIYLPQIQRYHKLFGKEQVLILGFNELVKDKIKTLNKILNFVGLQDSGWDFIEDDKRNISKYPQQISEEMKQKLQSFYENYNKELFEYLGRKVEW